jgi:hypothetical protein
MGSAMKRKILSFGILLVGLYLFSPPSIGAGDVDRWKKAEEGLCWAEFGAAGVKPEPGRSGVIVVRMDPRFYELKLLSSSEYGKTRLTVREWCQKQNLVCGINAGMYQQDGLSNVGYMKNFSHLNNSRLNRGYKAVLAFNRTDPSVPEVQIIDLVCQEFEPLKSKYQSFVQNIRMIGCRQENVWKKQERAWSIAAFGTDKAGNGLFIFSEPPYSGHDFVNLLLSLPLSIDHAMYLEGGPEASLYFSAGGITFETIGMHETSIEENRTRASARPVPNIIGLARKLK